jgi:glutathione peroxidase
MTIRQHILRLVYPLVMLASRISGKRSTMVKNEHGIRPPVSLYDLKVTLNDGTVRPLAEYKGKKLLLVNTASHCGYTDQYRELRQLQEQYGSKLAIIAFPANDFKQQEQGTDAEIASFCQLQYGISFPLAKKSTVVKGEQQNDVYYWLTHKDQNGWNEQEPTWNFSKYLVAEDGALAHYFDPAVAPLSKEILEAINE